jgi:hypothetical protein
MAINHIDRNTVGGDTVFVIPVGPDCQLDFVADTIDSVRYFAPQARIILIDDSQHDLGVTLAERYQIKVLKARVHGVSGGLFLNLSDGFREALTRPFRILVRLDTDALIAGSDFEAKAIDLFESDPRRGSLGSYRIGYDCVGIRSRQWAKWRIFTYLGIRKWTKPKEKLTVIRLLLRARPHGYKMGESIMGGAAVYRYEAIEALETEGLLGNSEVAAIGLQEDHIFGLCLFAIGFRLDEFGNKYDDLPMGVDWKVLPASPAELIELGKSIIHSTKNYEEMDEQAIRHVFRLARQQESNVGD